MVGDRIRGNRGLGSLSLPNTFEMSTAQERLNESLNKKVNLRLYGASRPTPSAPSYRTNTRLWNERVEPLIDATLAAGPIGDSPSPKSSLQSSPSRKSPRAPPAELKLSKRSAPSRRTFRSASLEGSTTRRSFPSSQGRRGRTSYCARLGRCSTTGEEKAPFRLDCPEIALGELTRGRGEGLFKLVGHFLFCDDGAEDFPCLRNAGVERKCGWVMEEDVPRSRAQRAIQETELLIRHDFLSFFVLTLLFTIVRSPPKNTTKAALTSFASQDGQQDVLDAEKKDRTRRERTQLGTCSYCHTPGASNRRCCTQR